MADQRQDMKAIELLLKELSKVKSIPKPPSDYAQAGKYKKSTEKVISECIGTMTDVGDYADRINTTIDLVRAALKDQTFNIQEAIKKALDSIQVGTGTGSGIGAVSGYRSNQALEYVKELQQVAKSANRLKDFMLKTEEKLAKVQTNVDVTKDDIDTLKGYLESWKLEKDENFEEEKRRVREEQRKRDEEEKRRLEEEERRRKEEEERRRKEEEERKKREEEERERMRREEEERLLEEERLRKEEEDRLKREEEERKKRDEEERRKREDEERRAREEEEARLREIERQRLEAERLAKERMDNEEAARKWRLDPNNWENTV